MKLLKVKEIWNSEEHLKASKLFNGLSYKARTISIASRVYDSINELEAQKTELISNIRKIDKRINVLHEVAKKNLKEIIGKENA